MKIRESLRYVLFLARRNFLASLGVVGLVAGIVFSFTFGNPPANPPNHLSLPPSAPFDQNISGLGLVEANTENISIGSFTSGIVSQVFVKAGDRVQKGDPLFTLDQRSTQAEISLQEREIDVAQTEILETTVDLVEKKEDLRRGEALQVGREISQSELKKRQFAVTRAQAQLEHRIKGCEQAKAKLALTKIDFEKLTVRAPITGTILKVRIHSGEFISDLSSSSQALILMGNIHPLHLRVQIDENDAWRFDSDTKAYAYLKSNKEIHFPLSFVRLDPYAQPKQQLSGDSAERVDTRVLEIIYKIEGNSKNIYIGQQFDVFIEVNKTNCF